MGHPTLSRPHEACAKHLGVAASGVGGRGAHVENAQGIAVTESRFDAQGRPTQRRFLDADRQPVPGPGGCAEVRFSYEGNQRTVTCDGEVR